MDDNIKIRLELEVAAQRIIGQYMINNKRVESAIEEGVKNAFESIDIAAEVEKTVRNAIEKAIRQSGEWGRIQEAVKKKTDEIVDTYIEQAVNRFKKDFEEK